MVLGSLMEVLVRRTSWATAGGGAGEEGSEGEEAETVAGGHLRLRLFLLIRSYTEWNTYCELNEAIHDMGSRFF